jgi:hypothetical protein
VAVLATGLLAGVWPLSWLGVLALEAGAVLLALNVVRTIAQPGPPLKLPARLVVVGQASLVTGLTLASVLVPVTAGGYIGGPGWSAVAIALLAGWVGCTVLGSLLHLTRIVTRVMGLGARSP